MDASSTSDRNDNVAPRDVSDIVPRDLMRELLPAARSEYIRAWELMADPAAPLPRRKAARTRAAAIAADHELVAAHLRGRESTWNGDDLLNARHLASELERHAAALKRLASLSVVGLAETKDLRPEALGCGRRYRDPARAHASEATKASRPETAGRGPRRDQAGDRSKRGSSSGAGVDRGPKVPKGALGTSKHDSTLGDDLDADTRAKLEALRAELGD